ncbi:hypothetical protein SFMTTN_2063 [Sulfuriferula multivorans]|uniref:HTH domain-containing protein n=1 Tax=Sulfuriferula multivorans TaxID=1559896 RepID=A0A401JF50_9PROT|nr:hypothetical protein [Sulfuriferula multivorans]GBL46250.1 hypothetical protein SFMTTN_2063 [Sulfuriferula multivorans]
MKTQNDLLGVLSRHIGRERAAGAAALARELGIDTRQLRKLVSELRLEGIAVCAHPRDGYYIAETVEELEETCQFLHARSMHALTLESRLRKIPLSDLIGQLHLRT